MVTLLCICYLGSTYSVPSHQGSHLQSKESNGPAVLCADQTVTKKGASSRWVLDFLQEKNSQVQVTTKGCL